MIFVVWEWFRTTIPFLPGGSRGVTAVGVTKFLSRHSTRPSVIPDLQETLFVSPEVYDLRQRYALLLLGEGEINHW